MDKTSEVCEKSKTQALMLEDAVFHDQSIEQDKAKLKGSSINTIKDLKNIDQSKSIFIRRLLHPYRLQLLIIFSMSIISIVVSSIYITHCHGYSTSCIIFIVQGVCGLFIVILHTCAIVFDPKPSQTVHSSFEYRWCIITTAHVATVFCTVWFFIGHVGFYQDINERSYYCPMHINMHLFTIIMVILHHVVGIWVIFYRILNSQRVLRWFEKKIQYHLNQLSDNDKLTIRQKTVDSCHSRNEDLIIF